MSWAIVLHVRALLQVRICMTFTEYYTYEVHMNYFMFTIGFFLDEPTNMSIILIVLDNESINLEC